MRTTPEDLEADPTGRRYEELVEQIFAEVGELQGLETVDLSRRKSVQGRTVKHEVDVWWTFRVGETTFTYAFQSWASKSGHNNRPCRSCIVAIASPRSLNASRVSVQPWMSAGAAASCSGTWSW